MFLNKQKMAKLLDPALAPHAVNGRPIGEVPQGHEVAYFGMGCFWGAEKLFWETPGVTVTAVGYQGGTADDPTYEQVCSGRTGHAEIVRVVYDPDVVSYDDLLKVFFENHDPTQGMRQGNDRGSQYRSAIYTTSPEQRRQADEARQRFQDALGVAGYGTVTTEIADAGPFHYAEGYHQQYGFTMDQAGRSWYCPTHATGVTCA